MRIFRSILVLFCSFLAAQQVPTRLDQVPGEFLSDQNNYMGRWIYLQTDITASGITVTISAPPRTNVVDDYIEEGSLANILVTGSVTRFTWAQFQKAKTLTAPFTVTARPNPLAVGGYQLQLQMLGQRLNQTLDSIDFYKFQEAPISFTGTMPVFCQINYNNSPVKSWFTTTLYSAFEGIAIAQSWDLNQIIQVANSFKSVEKKSVSFTLTINYDDVASLEQGTYWMSIFAYMSPYTPGSFNDQLNAIQNRVTPAVSGIVDLINSIKGTLQGENQLFLLTTTQKAILTRNQLFLTKELLELITVAKAQYKALVTPTSTDAQKAAVATQIAALNLTLASVLT